MSLDGIGLPCSSLFAVSTRCLVSVSWLSLVPGPRRVGIKTSHNNINLTLDTHTRNQLLHCLIPLVLHSSLSSSTPLIFSSPDAVHVGGTWDLDVLIPRPPRPRRVWIERSSTTSCSHTHLADNIPGVALGTTCVLFLCSVAVHLGWSH